MLTPDFGVLMGIIRQTIFDLSPELEISCVICDLSPGDLKAVEQVVVTSTAAGVIPVNKIGGTAIGQEKVGPVTRQIRKPIGRCMTTRGFRWLSLSTDVAPFIRHSTDWRIRYCAQTNAAKCQAFGGFGMFGNSQGSGSEPAKGRVLKRLGLTPACDHKPAMCVASHSIGGRGFVQKITDFFGCFPDVEGYGLTGIEQPVHMFVKERPLSGIHHIPSHIPLPGIKPLSCSDAIASAFGTMWPFT
jgi:hypothetical protein